MIGLAEVIARLRDRTVRRAADDEGVAMLSAIMFMIIMAGISLLLVSVVLGQLVPAGMAQKSTRTIYASQAGIQAALNVMRSAAAAPDASQKVYGSPSLLPCSISGDADGDTGSGVKYSVAIAYYSADPTGQSSTWLASNKLACPLSAAPGYALLTSSGAAPVVPGLSVATVGNRSIAAIYKFQVTNVNIPGGRIYDYNRGWCLHANSATAGSTVKFIAAGSCTDDTLELWIYDTDYEIKLAGTTAGGAAGLCITGPVNPGDPSGSAKLQACQPKTSAARWNQLWSWTGSNSWVGENQAITAPSSYCLATGYSAGSSLSAATLLVNNGCNGGFAPSAAVGAGAARYETHQIVNYKEFGRCADVTGENIGASYMISYPCKQDPTGTGVNLLWNHKWYYTEPAAGTAASAKQAIYVYYKDNTQTPYCLTAPTNPGYPVFQACSPSTPSAAQQWVRVNKDATYAQSYLFTDYKGRCLTAASGDTDGNWSKITVAACNPGDLSQKWNAPSTNGDSTVGGYKELN